MNRFLRILCAFAALSIFGVSTCAYSSVALERLAKFYELDHAYFAEFYQVILDESLYTVEESSGLMWLSRPDKFRWEYSDPYEQTIVSNGQNVWIYDVELDQVTVKPASEVIDQTPAEILSGVEDVDDNYIVEDLGIQGPLAWVSITPKNSDQAQFEILRLAFGETYLEVIEVLDALGSTTRIRLLDVLRNPELDDSTFQFVVPEGVDVIDTRNE